MPFNWLSKQVRNILSPAVQAGAATRRAIVSPSSPASSTIRSVGSTISRMTRSSAPSRAGAGVVQAVTRPAQSVQKVSAVSRPQSVTQTIQKVSAPVVSAITRAPLLSSVAKIGAGVTATIQSPVIHKQTVQSVKPPQSNQAIQKIQTTDRIVTDSKNFLQKLSPIPVASATPTGVVRDTHSQVMSQGFRDRINAVSVQPQSQVMPTKLQSSAWERSPHGTSVEPHTSPFTLWEGDPLRKITHKYMPSSDTPAAQIGMKIGVGVNPLIRGFDAGVSRIHQIVSPQAAPKRSHITRDMVAGFGLAQYDAVREDPSITGATALATAGASSVIGPAVRGGVAVAAPRIARYAPRLVPVFSGVGKAIQKPGVMPSIAAVSSGMMIAPEVPEATKKAQMGDITGATRQIFRPIASFTTGAAIGGALPSGAKAFQSGAKAVSKTMKPKPVISKPTAYDPFVGGRVGWSPSQSEIDMVKRQGVGAYEDLRIFTPLGRKADLSLFGLKRELGRVGTTDLGLKGGRSIHTHPQMIQEVGGKKYLVSGDAFPSSGDIRSMANMDETSSRIIARFNKPSLKFWKPTRAVLTDIRRSTGIHPQTGKRIGWSATDTPKAFENLRGKATQKAFDRLWDHPIAGPKLRAPGDITDINLLRQLEGAKTISTLQKLVSPRGGAVDMYEITIPGMFSRSRIPKVTKIGDPVDWIARQQFVRPATKLDELSTVAHKGYYSGTERLRQISSSWNNIPKINLPSGMSYGTASVVPATKKTSQGKPIKKKK